MARRKAFQFKITLEGINPPIWRRIQVSDLYTFWDLHVAIQDSMGWEDYHLHQFTGNDPRTGKPVRIGILMDDDFIDESNILPGCEVKIRDYFTVNQRVMRYEYDFGDGWEHLVEFEGAGEKTPQGEYPICIDGERACPPEDVGGPRGYERYLKVMSDPNHKDYQEMREWRGPYNPLDFNPKDVYFDRPSYRLKSLFT